MTLDKRKKHCKYIRGKNEYLLESYEMSISNYRVLLNYLDPSSEADEVRQQIKDEMHKLTKASDTLKVLLEKGYP